MWIENKGGGREEKSAGKDMLIDTAVFAVHKGDNAHLHATLSTLKACPNMPGFDAELSDKILYSVTCTPKCLRIFVFPASRRNI